MTQGIPFYRLNFLQFTAKRSAETLRQERIEPKEICLISDCVVDRSRPWYGDKIRVWHDLDGGKEAGGLVSPAPCQPGCYVKERARPALQPYADLLNFREVEVVSEFDYTEPITEPVYLIEAKQSISLDRQSHARSKVICACGRIHYRMPMPGFDVVASPGANTSFFVIAELPDSYIYIDAPTLKLLKKQKLVQGKCVPIGMIHRASEPTA